MENYEQKYKDAMLVEQNAILQELKALHLQMEHQTVCNDAGGNKMWSKAWRLVNVTEPSCDPRALGTKEIIEDRLINMGDITQELDAKIHEIENGWMKRAEELQSNLNSTEKTLEQCQRQKIYAELELQCLKGRNWWQRLWNK